ncbi:GntR family transcriptional regulator [Rhizobium sp.]
MTEVASFLSADDLQSAGQGPLYVKLQQALAGAIRSGRLKSGDALPPERDLAEYASISRVTVRKAVDELVRQGILVRRHGSGTFVAKPVEKVEQPLSRLTSFTEDMARRGRTSRAEWFERGLFTPSPDEMVMLGLPTGGLVARLGRLRVADESPLAIERASISAEFLPDPENVGQSLYAALEERGVRPVRAMQRISAKIIKDQEAEMLDVASGSAGMTIERISYLPSGKVIELTRSLYRADAYDFVAELTLG